MTRTTNKKRTRKNKARKYDARNQWGAPGLGLELNRRENGTIHAAWRAAFNDAAGWFRVKTFAIGKHGFRRAFYLAAQARHQAAPAADLYPLPTRAEVARHLRARIGPDWRDRIRPAWPEWWRTE